MKQYSLLVLFICLSVSLFSTPLFSTLPVDTAGITTVILVRHAEKGDDGTRNPDLNIYGATRSQHLAQLLHQSNVVGVYSTPFKRTQQTAQPLAMALGLEVQEYPPLDLEALDKLVKSHQGKTIVIVGHSNTVPAMANHLLGEEKLSQLGETEYDKIFMVQVSGDVKQLMTLSY